MIATIALTVVASAGVASQDTAVRDIGVLEQRLIVNPNDGDARWKLLYVYFDRVKSDPDLAIPARRRHIVWFIEHRPDDPLVWAGSTENRAMIVPRGDPTADPIGFADARATWMRQVESHANDQAVIRNAIMFLLLNDKPRAEELLKRAQATRPSEEWSAQRGFLYAIGIMGLDGMMGNLGPKDFNPEEAHGPFAAKARKDLETTTDPVVIGTAGYILTAFGTIRRNMVSASGFVFDDALAERLLTRALAAQPDNAQWRTWLDLLKKSRR